MMKNDNISSWRKRSSLRGLIIFYLAAFCIITSEAQNNYSEIISKVLENLDTNIEPCDNFYKFACGKFLKTTIIPDDKTFVDAFTLVEDKIQQQLKDALEEEIEINETKHVRMMKTFYQSCINETAINQKELQPALDILEKFGGWPVLKGNSWNGNNFNWQQLVFHFEEEGYPIASLFDFGVIIDSRNNSKRVLYINQPTLDLSHENLINGLEDYTVKAYFKYMVDIAVIFGADKKTAEEELKKSLQFEMDLVNISTPDKRKQGSLNNSMTIKELEEKYSTISWKEYFNILLKPNTIEDHDEVVVVDPSFFNKFGNLTEYIPVRDQANYIMWKVIQPMISYLNDNVRRSELQFLTDTNGQRKRESRWKECISLIKDNLGHSIGSLYIKKYFNKETKRDVQELFNSLKEAFRIILEKWMDGRESILDKIGSLGESIAYVDEILDDRKVDKFYEKLEITSGDYFKSMSNLTLFNRNYLLGLWKKPVNRTSWTLNVSPVIVDVFYSMDVNKVFVPGGILQEAFYNKNRPTCMNYGAIGSLLSHELTHSFDHNIRKLGDNKNFTQSYQSETMRRYISQVECFIHQYGNYTVQEFALNLNGLNTQTENIADNGGIEIAYLAYQKWLKRHGSEFMVNDLNYTESQFFWISTAQMWCANYRTQQLRDKILNDIYSPAEFRILGSFSNRPEFANDFKCPQNSKMIAKEKCSI